MQCHTTSHFPPGLSSIHPSDLVNFVVLVSPHEVEALHWRASEYGDVEGPDEGIVAQQEIIFCSIPYNYN